PTLGTPTMPHLRLLSAPIAAAARPKSWVLSFLTGQGLRPGVTRLGVHLVHRALGVAGLESRPDRKRAGYRIVDKELLLRTRWMKDIIRDLLIGQDTVARVTDDDAQSSVS